MSKEPAPSLPKEIPRTHLVARNEFERLMEELTRWANASLYMSLRLRGASDGLARKLSSLNLLTLSLWRRNGRFGEIEKQLMEGDFAQDAIEAAHLDAVLQADLLLTQVVGKGVEGWDNLPKEERTQAMEAAKLLKKDGTGVRKEQSYEDAIGQMRKRKK